MKLGRCVTKVARKLLKCVKKIEYTALGFCFVGNMLILGSMFITRWRVDDTGTAPLQNFWSFAGFTRKEYGLLQVRGSRSQSWTSIVRATCEWMQIAQVHTLGAASWQSLFGNEDGGNCGGSESCGFGYQRHMHDRCVGYDQIYHVSTVTLGVSFLTVLLSSCGILAATLGSLKRTGGLAFWLLFPVSLLALLADITWAVVTHFTFIKIGRYGWFPYPDLAIGFFLHLYGCLIVVVSSGVFGWLVLPIVWLYDPQQSKLDKRKRKLLRIKRMMQAREREEAVQQQQFLFQQGPAMPVDPESMNFPPPPGFAGTGQAGGAFKQSGPADIYGRQVVPGGPAHGMMAYPQYQGANGMMAYPQHQGV